MQRNVCLLRAGWIRYCAALAAVAVLIAPASAADWPQWGGPHGNFKADAHSLAASWSESGPKELWKRDLGEGYSAIVADQSHLYTMYRADDKEIVIALDLATGKTAWEHRYESAPPEGHEQQFGDGPNATPLIWGDRLYTIGVAGKMHCLNKHDGKPYWSQELWKDLGGSVLEYGYSSSPIRYKNSVIVLAGGENSAIIAFHKDTGEILWKNQSFKNSYSTPRIINMHGEDQLVTFMANEAIGVNPDNGELRWRYEIGNQWGLNVNMPIWFEDADTLFLSTTEAGARGLKITREGDGFAVEETWKSRKIQFYHVTSVRLGDYVYGSTGGSTGGPAFFAAINAKTGKIAWRKRGFSKATCVYADGRLIILDEQGKLALTTATPEDLVIHSQIELLDRVSWTVPTVVGSRMYVRDKKTIRALDLS